MAEKQRPNAAARGYGRRWQKTSEARLIRFPWCADPYKLHGKFPAPATCTDHIVAHKGDMKLFWDPTNWQSLCDSCNSMKAVKEEGAFGHRLMVGT
jgi:5-methylcytosine-specific restriction protein A